MYLKKLKKSYNRIVTNDEFYLLLASLEYSQKANDNLCVVKG